MCVGCYCACQPTSVAITLQRAQHIHRSAFQLSHVPHWLDKDSAMNVFERVCIVPAECFGKPNIVKLHVQWMAFETIPA